MKEIAKRLVPARLRAHVLKLAGILDGLKGLLSSLRLQLINRNAIRTINLTRRDKRITFVSERPSIREAKLAFGLKRAGWDVVQLHNREPTFAERSSFAEMQRFSSPASAAELAYMSGTRLFHVFAPNCDATCVTLVREKPGRVIIDLYDNFFGVADGLPDMQRKFALDIERQAFCYAHADAVCSRDLQMQYRRSHTRFACGKPILYFPEYCWNLESLPPPRSDALIRVVQVGWMGFETSGEEDVGCLRVIREFLNCGFEFHIYLHPSFPPIGSLAFNALFADYRRLAAETGLLHFHPAVSPTDLVRELMSYDYGFNMLNGSTFEGIPWTHHNPRRFPYCGSSRLFDYLDSGLGLLVDGANKLMHHTFRPFNVIYNGTELVRGRRLREALAARPARADIARARRALSIDRNIPRLIRFYESLL